MRLKYGLPTSSRIDWTRPSYMSARMKSVNVHEAKTHLSRLVERVEADEEMIIAKAGRPVACLVPIDKTLRPVP